MHRITCAPFEVFRLIYLDNAATSGLKPPCVIKAVESALKNMSVNPGRSSYSLAVSATETIFNIRRKISMLINCDNENNVCFTQNCTHSINAVLYGCLNKGDHVIISSLEHNAVWRPINYLFAERGIEFDIAEVNLFSDDVTVRNIKKLIKQNTKMIFVTAASNVIGKRLPLASIGGLCKEKDIIFGVDGAQGVGIMPIDMQSMNIDYLCIAPHKGLYAPMGTGVLVARKGIDKILISGGTGTNSIESVQPDDLPERIESGTLNVPGICGIGAGIDFINSKGIDKISDYEMNICKFAYRKLKEIGCVLYTEEPDKYSYCPVISFNVKGKTSDEVGEILSKHNIAVRTGLHCAPLAHNHLGTTNIGTVRISPSLFNRPQDIERLIFIVKSAI